MNQRLIGAIDMVAHDRIEGWAASDAAEIGDRLALIVNGQTTAHRAEIIAPPAGEPLENASSRFRFRSRLEQGDYIDVIDKKLGTSLTGETRVVLPPQAPQFELMLFCIMKREEAYLLEWIAYHRRHGFKIIIGDNSDRPDDPQSRVLQKLHAKGVIGYCDLIGRAYPQLPFYDAMLQSFTDSNAILGFLDADEFLTPMSGQAHAGAMISEYFVDPTVSAVALNWACFGSSGRQKREDGLVMDRFTTRAPQDFGPNRHVKSFVRGGRAQNFSRNPHAVVLKFGAYLLSDYSRAVWAPEGRGVSHDVKWNRLRINHYNIKSLEEHVQIKCARGSAIRAENSEIKRQESYFVAYDRNEVQDQLMAGYSRSCAEDMARLVE